MLSVGRILPFCGRLTRSVLLWFDTEADAGPGPARAARSEHVNWLRCLPFIAVHLTCLAVIWVGWSPFAVAFAAILYVARMFAVTAFYHRYFSHRTFKTSRPLQFLFALAGCTAVQRGPLWWAAHHREHHRHADTPSDIHSPHHRGFLWSHMLWFTCDAYFRTEYQRVKDLARYPELRFLNRFDLLIPVLFAAGILLLGMGLEAWAPSLGTNGPQLLVWGFFVSTVVLFHATFTINSLAHVFGRRRFDTPDQSRNNWFLALITLGEGWHNNHHRFPVSVRQGFRWWEVDMTYYLLKLMAALGLIWDLRPVPARILAEARGASDAAAKCEVTS
ncbi:Acyl-CoA desaturase [Sulfidibacter corallicola]|uniref:Acyl-CoA desaturase n=1 Tax=Sulfidibacter corallicola TaxID=2818388 RepID=A0A8A4TG28_SULCO|nr:acyl-CoA desaturase [Sulfidibacter corallicola]QTD48164.1 acyl-CoA desaturase [Sulfidibacter corallicola]